MIGIDLEFKKIILDTHIHDTLKNCYQCNRCTDIASTANTAPERYNPRETSLYSSK